MVVGKRAQVLGARLEQGALRIQHVEKAEPSQLVASRGGVERALRAGQQRRAKRLQFLFDGAQALVGLRKLGQQAHLNRLALIGRLVQAAARLENPAAVAVEQRDRDRDTKRIGAVLEQRKARHSGADRHIGHRLGMLHPQPGLASRDFATPAREVRVVAHTGYEAGNWGQHFELGKIAGGRPEPRVGIGP